MTIAVDGGAQPDAASTTDAIEARLARLFPANPPFGEVDRRQARRMLEAAQAEDGPFFMVNFVHRRARARYEDGRETTLTGVEADALYGQEVLPVLLDIGAEPVFVAAVETALMADDDVAYEQVGVVRYPSRAAFFDMLEREDFQAAVAHKRAAVDHTLVMVSEPSEQPFPDDFRAVDLTSVPNPPAPDEPPLAIVHLYAYREHAIYEDGRETELTGEEAVNLYSQGRMDQGVLELGVRPGLWLDIEGNFLHDERHWNQLRINLFPSRATFAGVAATSQEAGIEHRTAGLEHVYSLMTAPLINTYGYQN